MTGQANVDRTAYRLPAAAMGSIVDDYFESMDVRPWNRFNAFDWNELRPGLLTDDQRSALSFVTLIEDHLPGYFLEYQHLFPVDESVPIEDFVHNREVYRFSVKWAQEEDSHAHVLAAYQARAGLDTPDRLRQALAVEGRKPFRLLRTDPIQIFTYTLLQEKATQIFYQQFARSISEPVLRNILRHLARDEARHFVFFARTIEVYLERGGPGLLPAMQDVLQQFRMPLSDTLQGYWRWSIRVAGAVGGYDHSAAYDHLIRTISRCADAPTWSKVNDMRGFIQSIRATQ